jgi:hypothetical protein
MYDENELENKKTERFRTRLSPYRNSGGQFLFIDTPSSEQITPKMFKWLQVADIVMLVINV